MRWLLIPLLVMVLDKAVDGTISATAAAILIAAFVIVLGLGRRAGARTRVIQGPIGRFATVASILILLVSVTGGRLGALGPALGGLLVLSFLIFALWVIVAAPFGRRR